MRYYHRGWHRIADELEALLREGAPVAEHWFFSRDPRVVEIAGVVSRSRTQAPETLSTELPDLKELFQAAFEDPARLYDEQLGTANEFLDFHLALLLREADALGLKAIKPILPDDAGIAERINALGDAFNRFRAAKAHALVKLSEREEKISSDCSFSITIEPGTNIACFRLAGLFESADVERMTAERDRVFTALTTPPNRHLALVDIRQMTVQPVGGFTAFADMLSRHDTRALRIAFLIVPNSVGLQAQLAAEGRGAQFFTDEAQAREWLLGYDEPPLSFPARTGAVKARANK